MHVVSQAFRGKEELSLSLLSIHAVIKLFFSLSFLSLCLSALLPLSWCFSVSDTKIQPWEKDSNEHT